MNLSNGSSAHDGVLHYVAALHIDAILELIHERGMGMNWTHVIWDSTAGGNVEHVEEHDLTTDEVEHVLENFLSTDFSQSSGSPCVFGYTPDDRYIIVIYEVVDQHTVIPVTAYEVPEPK